MSACTRNSLVFIDAQLPDLATLRSGLPKGLEVHLLDPHRAGLKQIASALEGRHDIPALHLMVHGAPGKLFLGNSALGLDDLQAHADELDAIADALAEDGELLIYGCEVAAGREGRAFIDALTELTGLKVAAATHKVGHAELGGDWTLDVMPAIQSTPVHVPAWHGVLADAVLGGVEAKGNLKVTVLEADGTMVIDRFDGTDWNTQFYDPDDEPTNGLYGSGATPVSSGNIIEINGKTVPLGNYAGFGTSDVAMSPEPAISMNGNTITVVWTIDNTFTNLSNQPVIPDGTVVVTQRITLPAVDSQSIDVEWDITNNTGGDLTNVRLARVVDSFLAGGDNGTGYSNPGTNTVGVIKTADGIQQKMTITGVTPPTDGESGLYSDVLTHAATPSMGLGSVIDETDQDNGYGMEWVIPTLVSNATTTIKAVESFEAASVIPHDEATWGRIDLAAGNTTTLLRFDVKNISASDKNTTFTVSAPDGWTAEIQQPDISYAGSLIASVDHTQAFLTVFVRVTIPAGVTPDNYNVTLNINAEGDRSQSTALVSIDQPTLDLNGGEDGINLTASLPAGSTDGSTAVAFGANATFTELDGDGAAGLEISYNPAQMVSGDTFYLNSVALDLSAGMGLADIDGQDCLWMYQASSGEGQPNRLVFVALKSLDPTEMQRFTGAQIETLLQNLKFDTTEVQPASGTRVFNVSIEEGGDLDNVNPVKSPVATLTVNVGPQLVALDLDQVGDGNADTNNSTAVHELSIPSYFADSGSVLGNDAPDEYKKLTISFDVGEWDEDTSPYVAVAPEAVTDSEDEANYLRLTRDEGYWKAFASGDYGGTADLKLTLSGPYDGARTLTIEAGAYDENNEMFVVGTLTKSDLNKFLQNAFFYESESRFDETRVFSLKATAADDSETAVSTFSVTCAPDTTAPVFEEIDNSDDFEAPLAIDYFKAADGNDITLVFDETVTAVAGKYIKLWKVVADGDDLLVGSYEVTDEDHVEVDEDEVELSPKLDNDLENGAQYYFTIDAGAFVDDSNNPLAAFDSLDTWSFTTIAAPLGTWNVVDANQANEDLDPAVGNGHRGNLEITANGKYVLLAEDVGYKESIGSALGLTVKKMNEDGTWSYVGENGFASTPTTGLFDLAIATAGTTDTLYTVSMSNANFGNGPNDIRVHTFKDAAWVQVGGTLQTDIGTTAENTGVMQAPKAILTGDGGAMIVAYATHKNDAPNIVVQMAGMNADDPSQVEWQAIGAPIASGAKNAFDLALAGDGMVLGIANADSGTKELRFYEPSLQGDGFVWAESSVIPSISMSNMAGDSNSGSSLKMALDGNGVLYAVYGLLDSSATDIAVSRIDLAADTPAWEHLPVQVDAMRNINSGTRADLAFDDANLPYLSLIDGEGYTNVYKWDATASNWRELDTGSSLNNIFLPVADLEINDNELSLLMTSFGNVHFASYTPNPDQGGGDSDTTAPAYQNASINGTTLTLAYDEALKADGLPAASAFTLKVNGEAVSNGISSVAINGQDNKKLDLTLANPVYFGQTVTISYAEPTTDNDDNAIQDVAGNDAASFTDYGVANNTDATDSVIIGSQLQGEQVTLAIGGGLSINNATNSAAPTNLGKSVKMPLGKFEFNITGLQNGGTAQLSMTADADLKQLTYYKWNYLTNKYVNIAKSVSIDTQNNKATVFFELVDGGAYDADREANGTIVDPGGVAENKLLPVILENATAVGDVTALNTDSVNGTLSYAITGGADAAKFSINSSTGALSFNSAPNFEAPTDDGDTADNNTYAVTVTVTGSNGGSEVQPLIVTVMNVPEAGDPTVGSNVTAVEATLTVNAPPSSGGGGSVPASPPPATSTTTTNNGVTVTTTTSTTTASDGRVLDVVSIAPVTAPAGNTGGTGGTTGTTARAEVALYYGNADKTIPATTASLPTGVGLTATGARTPANNTEALANLIQLVKDTAGEAEAQKNNMTGGGEKFLAALDRQAEKGPLIVNSVKLNVAEGTTAAPDKPITIEGSAEKVAGTNGRPVEAIVIDVRDLPKGTKLELKNVEFAVIVGDGVEVIGGNGQNIVYAGTGSQKIVLGEDDDELHGGDGDDVIGSEGGNDLLHGDAGNDTVFGGEGDDTLWGGAGDDDLSGDAGSDTASYSDAASAVKVSLAKSGWQKTGGAGKDKLKDIENLTGSDFNDTLKGSKFDNVLEGGAGKDNLSAGKGVDTASYASALSGVTVAIKGGWQETGGAGRDKLSGFENLLGSAFDDTLTGGRGSNVLTGGLGVDTLTGGAGADQFRYEAANEGGDRIADFVSGQDKLVFVGSEFGDLAAGTLAAEAFVSGAGAVAGTAGQLFLFDTVTGRLFFDADGSGAGEAVLIATLTGVASLNAQDVLIA